jgi:hypothetical protein
LGIVSQRPLLARPEVGAGCRGRKLANVEAEDGKDGKAGKSWGLMGARW